MNEHELRVFGDGLPATHMTTAANGNAALYDVLQFAAERARDHARSGRSTDLSVEVVDLSGRLCGSVTASIQLTVPAPVTDI